MKILAATTNFPSTRDHHRGVFLESDLRALSARGHDVTCIVSRSLLRDRSRYVGDGGLRVDEGRYLSLSYVRGLEHWFGMIAQRNSTRSLRRLLRRHEPGSDVVYAKFLNTAPLLRLVDPRMGRVLGIGEGIDSVHDRLQFFRAGEFPRCLEAADILEVKNEQVANWLRHHHPVHASKIRLVPSGVDTAFFTPGDRSAARGRLGLADDAFVAIFVGPRTLNKGGDRFLQACALAGPATVPVLLGAGWSGVEQPARALGVVDRTTVRASLQAADVFVLPSFSEGMPNAVLEALACAVPCVVADLPYTSFLTHDVDCVKADPADPQAIASAIRGLRDSPATRARLRHASRETAVRLALDTRIDLLEGCFRESLAAKEAA